MIDIKGYDELNKEIWNNKDKLIMLYFGASWCGPCQMLKEKIKNNQEEINKLYVIHIDCDLEENEDIVSDWSVSALPTQIFVHLNGENVVKDEKVEGYDWIKLVMSYQKIIEKKSN